MTPSLAQQWPASAEHPADVRHEIARELEQARAEREDMRQRYATSQQQLNAAHHEIERLRAANARLLHEAPPWIPEVHITCDGRCGAVVAFDPAPEEAAMTQALVALGWSGHYCRGCR